MAFLPRPIQHGQISLATGLSVPWDAIHPSKKFPAPLRREFCCKPLNSLADWARKSPQEGQILQNSLFFSLLPGNFEVETGSIRLRPPPCQSASLCFRWDFLIILQSGLAGFDSNVASLIAPALAIWA